MVVFGCYVIFLHTDLLNKRRERLNLRWYRVLVDATLFGLHQQHAEISF